MWTRVLMLGLFLLAPVLTLQAQDPFEPLNKNTTVRLLALAEERVEQGCFRQALEILNQAEQLDPSARSLAQVRARLRGRQAEFEQLKKDAIGLDLGDRAIPLLDADKKKLTGWKTSRGKWLLEKGTIVCESPETEAFLFRGVGNDYDRFQLTFHLKLAPERSAGVVLGSVGREKTGLLFEPGGIRPVWFKSRESTDKQTRFTFKSSRFYRIEICVRGERVQVLVDGKEKLAAKLPGLVPSHLGFYSSGGSRFKAPALSPLESVVLLERAEKALRQRETSLAASLLLRGLAGDPDHPRILAHLVPTLAALDYGEESLRLAGALLGRKLSDQDRVIRRANSEATACMEQARLQQEELEAVIRAYGDAGREIVSSLCETGRIEAAQEALDRLVNFDLPADRLEDLRVRVFLAVRGAGAALPLLKPPGLTGWESIHGDWEVDGEGVLQGACDLNSKAYLEAKDLLPFDRYLIHTQQKGTGSYINQGLQLTAGSETYHIRLYKPMVGHQTLVGRKISIENKDGAVFFKAMQEIGLAANAWYDVDLLVDRNLVTLLFNGRALFTKVLPQQARTGVRLFVAEGRKGNFRDITLTPFGEEAAFRRYTEDKGLTIRCVGECETLGNGGQVWELPFAYNGRALRQPFKNSKPLSLPFHSLTMDEAMLSLRCAIDSEEETRLRLALDGTPLDMPLLLQPTGGSENFSYFRATLGPLAPGRHTLELTRVEGGPGLFLDRFEITAPGDAPKGEIKQHASPSAPNFKIRLSPGLDLPQDPEAFFGLLEVVRDYMVDYYGFEPPTPLYFNLIARECWADPRKGGYAAAGLGNNLYIPEDNSYSNLAVIMHEISHCFDHRMGFNPPWFGEGKSFPCYDQFVSETRGEYRKYRQLFSLADKKTGAKTFKMLAFEGGNLFPFWGTKHFPYWDECPDGRDLTHLGYVTANWFCSELSDLLGPDWLKNYFTLLRRDLASGAYFMPRDRAYANSVIADYFSRSAGRDLNDFFKRKGFALQDFYAYDSLVLACGENDWDYINDSDNAPESEGPVRVVEGGFVRYALPVDPTVESLTLEVTMQGKTFCEAEGERLFRTGLGKRLETRRARLTDPALFADGRLVLRFAAEEGEPLTLSKIVLRR